MTAINQPLEIRNVPDPEPNADPAIVRLSDGNYLMVYVTPIP